MDTQANASGAIVTNANPLSQDIKAQITSKLVEPKEVKFNFRSITLTDDKGTPILEADGKTEKKWKRPTFVVNLPLLTVAGLIAALQSGDKSTELALDAANEAVVNRMRGMIQDKIEVIGQQDPLTADEFDLSKLSFLAIANMPKSERGSGISKEEWADFGADYKITMQKPEAIEATADKKARAPEVLDKHVALLVGKFNQVRSRKDVVQQMLEFLDVYIQFTDNGEQFMGCYEFLVAKGKTILTGEEYNDL